MARKPRIHYKGALYHVIARGNNKNNIFKCDGDKLQYLKRVKKYKEKYESKIYAYVIMDNHVHLLIEVSETPLSKIMQLIQQTYTQYYNKKYNRTGHVFEQRYKAILCNKNEYLLSLIRYIHNNPKRTNISDINYKWSSHKEYISNKAHICDTDFPLSIFSNDKKIAKERYLKYVTDEETRTIEEIKYELAPKANINTENKKNIRDKSIDDIIKDIEKVYKINIEDLKGRSKNRYISNVKKNFIREILDQGLMSQKELAEYLKISEMAVSKIKYKV